MPACINGNYANLIGEDGVTERTGESSRPLDIWLAKGPNLRHGAEHSEGKAGG